MHRHKHTHPQSPSLLSSWQQVNILAVEGAKEELSISKCQDYKCLIAFEHNLSGQKKKKRSSYFYKIASHSHLFAFFFCCLLFHLRCHMQDDDTENLHHYRVIQADISLHRFDENFIAESITGLHRSEVNQFFFIKMQSYASSCRKKI